MIRSLPAHLVFWSLFAAMVWPFSSHADEGMSAYQDGNYAIARVVWEKKAFSDPYAAYNLGTLYETGKGGEADYKLAFKWYDEAAGDARGDKYKALKRKAVMAIARLVIKTVIMIFTPRRACTCRPWR